MTTVEQKTMKQRRGASATWTANNPVLNDGEIGFEQDTRKFKIGNGTLPWSSLPYIGSTGLVITGSLGSPSLVLAGIGITPVAANREYRLLAGNAGPVVVSAVPGIAAGTVVGQELILEGVGANSVTLNGDAGVDLNGTVILGDKQRIYLIWNGSAWGEVSRK